MAGLFGARSGLGGAVLSSLVQKLPTGPTIVLCMTGLMIVSLLFAPNRGLAAEWLRRWHQKGSLESATVLADLYRQASQHPDPATAPPSLNVLRAISAGAGVHRALRRLKERGLVLRESDGRWRLTPDGVLKGRELAESSGAVGLP